MRAAVLPPGCGAEGAGGATKGWHRGNSEVLRRPGPCLTVFQVFRDLCVGSALPASSVAGRVPVLAVAVASPTQEYGRVRCCWLSILHPSRDLTPPSGSLVAIVPSFLALGLKELDFYKSSED